MLLNCLIYKYFEVDTQETEIILQGKVKKTTRSILLYIEKTVANITLAIKRVVVLVHELRTVSSSCEASYLSQSQLFSETFTQKPCL